MTGKILPFKGRKPLYGRSMVSMLDHFRQHPESLTPVKERFNKENNMSVVLPRRHQFERRARSMETCTCGRPHYDGIHFQSDQDERVYNQLLDSVHLASKPMLHISEDPDHGAECAEEDVSDEQVKVREAQIRRFQIHAHATIKVLADGVVFPNGRCAIAWRGPFPAVSVYHNLGELELTHGHNDATVIHYLDPEGG